MIVRPCGATVGCESDGARAENRPSSDEGGAMSRQLLEYHSVIGYRFIPGLKARVEHEAGGYLVRTNGAGFRCDREFLPARGPSRRALLFGDSYTAGDGVSNGKRYGDLLETMVPNLEVYNFGLSGSGTDQQYLAYREFARGIERDLVIIAVFVENIMRVNARYRFFRNENNEEVLYEKPYFSLGAEGLTLHGVPPERRPLREMDLPPDARSRIDAGGRFASLRLLARRLGIKDLAQRITRYNPVVEYNRPDDPRWLLMRALLAEWIREIGGPVLVVPVPLYQFIEGTSDPSCYQARFAELARDTGCHLHDPLPDLKAYPKEERRAFRFARDVHYTPAGHRALAASLAPAVQSILDAAGS